MFTKEEIFEVLEYVIDVSKDHDKNGYIQKKAGYYPEYWEGYNEAIECNEKIRVHSEKGYFPECLFTSRSPNQTDEELEWIKDNYKQITLDVFSDYINTRGRAWHRSNWSIQYNEDEDQFQGQGFKSYVEGDIKTFGSFEKYIREVISVLKARDPEGVLVIKPKEVNVQQREDGTFFIPDNQLINPQPYYYSVDKIVSQHEDYFLIETGEKSLVTYQNQQKRIGRVFEFYDNNNIWKISQVGKKIEDNYQIELYYKHDLGKIPVQKLMGIPKILDGEVRWESPFIHAVDNLDLVLLDSSHLQMAKAKSAYPIRIMAANECEHTENGYRCSGGYIGYVEDGVESRKKCTSCDGTGYKHRLNPLGEILFNPKEFDEANSSKKLLEYVAPDVSTLEFLQDQIEKNEQRARRNIHLTTTGESVGNKDKTATQIAMESKATISFIKNIADQEFSLFGWGLEIIGLLRYGNLFNGFTLYKPNNFDFVTEEDYINQISKAKEAGVPPMSLRFILQKYIKSNFGQGEAGAVVDLVMHSDRLLELSSQEIALKRVNGLVAPWEDVLHCSGVSLVNELIIEDDNFLQRPFVEQKQLLEDKAKEVASSISNNEIDEIVNADS